MTRPLLASARNAWKASFRALGVWKASFQASGWRP